MRFDPGKAVVTGQPEPVTQRSLVAGSGDVSHDGEWGAFTTQGRQKEDVFVIRKDGTGIRQLTDDPYRNRLPTWSPDGKRLAFYSNRSGKMEIWTIHSKIFFHVRLVCDESLPVLFGRFGVRQPVANRSAPD